MLIQEKKIPIREIFDKYSNDSEEGVVGYGGRLDIRPQYQREFVYKDNQRDEVIHTILKDRPLNVFYWAKTGEDTYEILDGQQRTISFCDYINNRFTVDDKLFVNLPEDKKEKILDYELFVYICDGTDSEKLDWFTIINIAGEELTKQELRNAVYAGPWVSDAKRYFSKTGCAASTKGEDYLKGSSIRQEFLETALRWAADKDGVSIEQYMAKHQQDPTAVGLWNYFCSVIDWTKAIFPHKRKEMKGLPWGLYYNKHSDRTDLDPDKLEKKIQELLSDDDVTRISGVYEYLLTGKESALSIRKFSDRDKKWAYEKQNHKCAACGEEFTLEEMEGDHKVPWSKGGHTVKENLQMLCTKCNLIKSDK